MIHSDSGTHLGPGIKLNRQLWFSAPNAPSVLNFSCQCYRNEGNFLLDKQLLGGCLGGDYVLSQGSKAAGNSPIYAPTKTNNCMFHSPSQQLFGRLFPAARDAGHAACGGHISGMFGFFFCEGPVRNYADATKSDTKKFAKWHRMNSKIEE